ncbi:MAG: molybdopterin converting factor subunit 1 [Alphaproteobacteria bacterium]|nr:molybdopterin converting factor subunit 1 [Alphaproteobacteria bacterium]
MKILYFASIRARVGHGEEEIALPPDVKTVADLVGWLKSRGDTYAEALAEARTLRAALNQEHVSFDAAIKNSDEVAFFPPVTGG